MRRLRSWPTAVRWALLAILLLAVSGASATAAKRITGGDVANSSLTGKDVRNSSLTGADIRNRSLDARDFEESIRGPQGPPGPPGPAPLGTLRRVLGNEAVLPPATVDPGTGGVIPSVQVVTADCPENPPMAAASGGWELTQDGGAVPVPFIDRDAVTGWFVAVQNLSLGTATIRAVAYCAEFGKAITVLPEGFASAGATLRRDGRSALAALRARADVHAHSVLPLAPR
jgi:hypothetical protein